jgi:glycosyltransferase involved in cell wall biosynthesis
MRIGVDATCWQNRRGYGRHARALLHALVRLDAGREYKFFVDSPEDSGTLPRGCESRILSASVPAAQAASAKGRRSLKDMWHASRALASREFDLLLFPTIYTYVPVFSRAKKLVIIHDVIAETYPDLTIPRTTARWLWNTKVALGRRQADALVTVSEYSRRCILEHFRMRPEQVFVVGEASDPVFRVLPDARPTPQLTAMGIESHHRLVIYVGGFSPHKNLESLVESFARNAAQFPEAMLVMVGEYEKEVFHSYFGTIAAQVKRLGIEDRVVFTGYLPDEELVILLNLGSVLALPSFMEGFGLPAVEAAACGCPVIATKASPLPELLGKGGIYVEPRQDALDEALREVLGCEPLRQQMREAGLAAARQLTWDAAARQMMDVMSKVTGG